MNCEFLEHSHGPIIGWVAYNHANTDSLHTKESTQGHEYIAMLQPKEG